MIKGIIGYVRDVFLGVKSLLKGMRITAGYFFSPSEITTQQYPDNRKDLKMFDRYKGEVVMPHNDKNEHKCTGCGICEMSCPNGSIEIISKTIETEDGKKKKAIDKHIYHLGMCTFCNLCVKNCPSGAIVMSQKFEHAVFDRSKLTKVLNQPGSQLMKGIE
jgi:NADH-quinone oxidoreductase subunit I